MHFEFISGYAVPIMYFQSKVAEILHMHGMLFENTQKFSKTVDTEYIHITHNL